MKGHLMRLEAAQAMNVSVYRVTFGPMLAFLLFTFVIGVGLSWIVMAVAHA